MRHLFALALAVGLFATFGCGKSQPTAPAVPALDGDYRATKMNFLGKWINVADKRNLEMTIKGEKMITTGGLFGGDAAETLPIKTDPSKTPATIDLTTKEDGKEDVIRGLYKFEGDELTIIFGMKDRDKGEVSRPKDFTPNEDTLIFVLKRK